MTGGSFERGKEGGNRMKYMMLVYLDEQAMTE